MATDKTQAIKLNETEKRMELTVRLDSLFDGKMPNDPGLRQAIGQKVIDLIKERTLSGRDVDGKRFKKYSEAYAGGDKSPPSAAFVAFGKSKQPVNLFLSGAMLDTLDIKNDTKNTIKLGWSDSLENAKAFAHNTGYEGHRTIKDGPQRRFFDLNPSEIKQIRDTFQRQVQVQQELDGARKAGTTEATALKLLKEILNGEN